MNIINPATEEIIATLEEDSTDVIRAKFAELKTGQKVWQKLSVSERLRCIVQFGSLVKEQESELAQTLTNETGKPIQQSLNEIRGAQNRIDHLQANAEKWLATETLVNEGVTHELIKYEPLGVIANISAWNFPYNVGYNVFLYALVSGNVVMYKPSEYATLTGLKFEELLHKAGVPSNVFKCIVGGAKAGAELLKLDLDGYFFTGSYPTGRLIAETVARKLVPVQLELGGKDPLYIMDDVMDVKEAAVNAAEGAFYNNGQSCCAVERIYVQEGIYDEFTKAFKQEVEQYKIGDPNKEDTFIGPLSRKAQLNIIFKQVDDALQKGARLLTGGKELTTRKGYYMEPTVLCNVNHSMDLMKEESFGPIIGIQKVSNDEEALGLMQDTSYGLTAAVFSANKDRADKILSAMNTGTVYWNCCDRVSPNIPWSGRKNSGLGSTLSYMGIRSFVQAKAYHLRQG